MTKNGNLSSFVGDLVGICWGFVGTLSALCPAFGGKKKVVVFHTFPFLFFFLFVVFPSPFLLFVCSFVRLFVDSHGRRVCFSCWMGP